MAVDLVECATNCEFVSLHDHWNTTASPSTIYVGTDTPSGYGLLKSTDGGSTLASTGLAGDNITALAFDPVNPNIIYAATDGSRDSFITVLDPTGAMLFSSQIGGTGGDEGHAITQTASGNVFMAGLSSSPTTSPNLTRASISTAWRKTPHARRVLSLQCNRPAATTSFISLLRVGSQDGPANLNSIRTPATTVVSGLQPTIRPANSMNAIP